MSIRRRIALGLALLVAIFLVVEAVALPSTAALIASNRWVVHTLAVRSKLESTLELILDNETGARGFALSGEDRFLEPERLARAELPAALEQLRRLTADNPTQQRHLDRLEVTVHERLQASDRIIEARRTGGLEAAATLVAAGQGGRASEVARGVIAEMIAEESALLAQRSAQAERNARYALLVLGGAMPLALLLGFAAQLVVARSITLPLNDLLMGIKRMGAGDLAHRLAGGGKDELGALAAAFNEMARLRERAEEARSDLLAQAQQERTAAEEARRQAEEASRRDEHLLGLIQVVLTAEGLEGVFFELLRRIKALFDVDTCAVLLASTDARRLCIRYALGLEEEEQRGIEIAIGQGFAGKVAMGEEPVYIEDLACVEVASPILRASGVRSILGVPLRARGTLVGVLHIGAKTPRRFSPDEVRLLEAVGGRVALAVDHTRLFDAEQALRRQLEALVQLGVELADLSPGSPIALEHVLRAVVEGARRVLDAEYAALGLGTDPSVPFDPWVASGTLNGPASSSHRPRPVGNLGAAAVEGRVVRLEDVTQSQDFRGFPPEHPLVTAFLGVPVHHRGKRVGTMYVGNKAGGAEFSVNDQRIAELLAAQAGVVLENARLYEALADARGRMAFLAEASATLAETLDRKQLMERLARLGLPLLGDAALVCLLREEGPYAASFAHTDAAKEASLRDLVANAPAAEQQKLWTSLFADRKPSLVRGSSLFVIDARLDGDTAALAADLAPQPAIAAPFVAGERVLGGILFLRACTRSRPDERDLRLAEALASRAALALENCRLLEEARAAVAAREDLMAIVSHDLRNPLAAIGMNVKLLARGTEHRGNDGVSSKPLASIASAALRMQRLIEDLLFSATLDHGHLTVQPFAQDLAPVLEELREANEPLLSVKSLRFEVRPCSGLPPVMYDRPRLLQALSNFVSNAVKFTPCGGTITVEVTRLGSHVRVAVSDTGPGIPDEDIPHLFNRYWKGKSGGTGLGLYIAKGIAEAHGGNAWAENRPGGGAMFFLTLPVAQAAAA